MSYAEQLHQSQEMQLTAALAQVDSIGWLRATAPGEEEVDELDYDRLDAVLRLLGVKDGMAGIDTTAPEWENLRDFALG